MRRTVGLVLAGLGAFFIVIAIVLPTYIVPSITKFPLNEYKTATLTGSNVTYFNATRLAEYTGANITAKYTVKGHGEGTSSTAVWELFSDTYDTTNAVDVQPLYRKFAFDRQNTQIVNCCGANIDGKPTTGATGNVGYVFPFGTQRKTYMVYDQYAFQPEPFVYSGQDTIDGITTYKFTEDVKAFKIGLIPLSATNPEYYTTHVVYWVDPETGALLNVDETVDRYLADPNTSAVSQVLFDGELQFTPATIQSVVDLDNSGRAELTLLNTILPLTLGFLGFLGLVFGLVLYRTGTLAERSGRPDTTESGLAAATAEHTPDAGAPAAAAAPGERMASPRHAAPVNPPTDASLIPGMDHNADNPGASAT